MSKFKLVILIHSLKSDLYNYFREKHKKMLHHRNDIKIFFVYGNSGDTLSNIDSSDILYEDIDESKLFPGLLQKTIRAFDEINQKYLYDYLIRISLSTILDFELLLQHIKNLPKENLFCGGYSSVSYKKDGKKISKRAFVRGCAILFSRDVIEKLIARKEEMFSLYDINSMSDDKIITWFIEDHLKIKPKSIKHKFCILENVTEINQEVITTIENAKQNDIFVFRIKNKDRLKIDTKLFDIIFERYYSV